MSPVIRKNPRQSEVERRTGETQVKVALNLDGTGKHDCQTGIGFLDHMLAQLAYHGLLDLEVRAAGDLQVDPHHTVEDVGLALGEAFFQALGDCKGIVRMGSAYAPMDESLAFACADFSGRPYAVVQAEWHAPQIGMLPTSLITHFWESLAVTARANLHLCVLAGRDDHHQCEALFKAAGRAIDAAIRLEPRRQGQIPSTKGTL